MQIPSTFLCTKISCLCILFSASLLFRSTTGNFGPGRSGTDVNAESVMATPERQDENVDSDDQDSVPLVQLQRVKKTKNQDAGQYDNMNFTKKNSQTLTLEWN